MSSVDLSGSGVPWWTATRNGSLSQNVLPMLTNWNVCDTTEELRGVGRAGTDLVGEEEGEENSGES
jgi:hypothetical protein